MFHYPQFLYLLAVTSFVVAPELINIKRLRELFKTTSRLVFGRWSVWLILKWIVAGVLIAINIYLIKRFTYAHLYLISDNRHYTFYIWQRVFSRYPNSRFWLLPLYWVAGVMYWNLLCSFLFQHSSQLLAQNLLFIINSQPHNPRYGDYYWPFVHLW